MWKALNGWGKGNLFKLNKFIHTREARGTGVTAQSGGARPSPHFPGPRVSGRRHSRPVSGCAMSRDVSAPTRALAETMTTQLSSYSREGEMTFSEKFLRRRHRLFLSTRLQSQFRDGHRNGHALTGSLQKGLCGHRRSPGSFLHSGLFLRNLGQPDRTPRDQGGSASERTNSAAQNVYLPEPGTGEAGADR